MNGYHPHPFVHPSVTGTIYAMISHKVWRIATFTTTAATNTVIALHDVSKVYTLFRSPVDYLRAFRRSSLETVTALQRTSLDIREGDVVGLLGRNGAGKSTLLRLIAGIATPTTGTIAQSGDIYPLLDLTVGMHPLLTGRQNIYRRQSLFGLSRRQVDEHLEEIIDFAELTAAIDEPLITYSTGMKVRLAFATATAFTPEIMLIDEVLAVGDEFFVAKSFRRIQELASAGKATLVASHDWSKAFRLCNRMLWLSGGQIIADGRPEEIMYRYLEFLNAFKLTHAVEIEDIAILDDAGNSVDAIESGHAMTIAIRYRAQRDVSALAVIAEFHHAQTGEGIFSNWSPENHFVIDHPERQGTIEIQYLTMPLAPGPYYVQICLVDPEQGPFPIDFYDIWSPVTGHDTWVRITGTAGGGLFHFPLRWSVVVE